MGTARSALQRKGVPSKKTPGTEGSDLAMLLESAGRAATAPGNIKGAKSSSRELFVWAEHRSPLSCRAQRGARKNCSTCGMAERPSLHPKERGCPQGCALGELCRAEPRFPTGQRDAGAGRDGGVGSR